MTNDTRRVTLPQWPVRNLRATVIDGPGGGAVGVAEEDHLSIGSADSNTLVLTDELVSRYHAEVSATPNGFRVRDMGSTNGTFVLGLRVTDVVVPPRTQLKVGATTIQIDEGKKTLIDLHEHEELGGLRGQSLAMRRAMAQLAKVAPSKASVLLVGESGTGKELAARVLHDASSRAEAPFVVVDCASIVPGLVQSELFGHERGAFTGADRTHVGAFEDASGGTLFLDEIGELPASVQPALLGALERRRIRRVGGKDDIPIDVRLVAATHRDLRADVNSGIFRLDLYYRLAVVVIELPPLRERRNDLRLLVEHFLREAGSLEPIERVLPQGFIESLASYHFPGNVRELRNLVEAALATGESPQAQRSVSSASSASVIDDVLDARYREARDSVLGVFERRYLQRLLERAGDNVSQAARIAEMDRSHLTSLLRRHGFRTR